MRALTLAVCAAATVLPLGAALAAPAAPAGGASADARCLMTMAALASSKDENSARIGQAGVVYFAGKVKAEEPSYNFASRLKAVAATMNGESLQAEAQRCGPMVVNALNELQAAQKSFAGSPPAAGAAPPPPKK